jgi:spore germination cell wall hydrolase CwlJ-like protein
MFERVSFALVVGAVLLFNSGCTTTNTAETTAQSFAPMPELAIAPTPVSRPETEEAKASLAASVEEGVVTETVAFAPETKPTEAIVAVAPKKAIPDEAVDVANAEPVTVAAVKGSNRDRECLMRAMYFESNRSSRDGQLAVGTVVMHRLAHGAWGTNVCGVVGAKRQFAPGVMTRKMQGDTSDLAALADGILAGKRHPKLAKNVMFFHVAGMKFPYKNMRYVLVAGGNTFYYKASRKRG